MMSRASTSVRRNIREICEIEKKELRARSKGEQIGDLVAVQSGRLWFIVVHAIWFTLWIVLNSGHSGHRKAFDPFPFPLLTLVVSLESIFLSLFILMSQNRSSRQADERAHLDLQIKSLGRTRINESIAVAQGPLPISRTELCR